MYIGCGFVAPEAKGPLDKRYKVLFSFIWEMFRCCISFSFQLLVSLVPTPRLFVSMLDNSFSAQWAMEMSGSTVDRFTGWMGGWMDRGMNGFLFDLQSLLITKIVC